MNSDLSFAMRLSSNENNENHVLYLCLAFTHVDFEYLFLRQISLPVWHKNMARSFFFAFLGIRSLTTLYFKGEFINRSYASGL
jgi:hypothetical protein